MGYVSSFKKVSQIKTKWVLFSQPLVNCDGLQGKTEWRATHTIKSIWKGTKTVEFEHQAHISKIHGDIEIWKFGDYEILSYLGLRKLP